MIDKPLIDAHGKQIKDILGKVLNGYREEKLVKYEAKVDDEKAKTLIRNGTVKKVSVGLLFEYNYNENIDGEEYLVLCGLSTRELSLTLYPAISESSVETYQLDFVKEEDINQTHEDNESLADEMMILMLENKGYKVFDSKEYKSTQEKLIEVDKLGKRMYWLEHTDVNMIWKLEYEKFSLEQIQEIINIARDLSREQVIRTVAGDYTPADKTVELKEDIREMIFHKRRNGKPLKINVHTIKDLEI